MASCFPFIPAAVSSLSMVALAQQPKPSDSPAIVQPGAPGQPGKTLSAADLNKPVRTPAQADVPFMQGMIHHHAQAAEMVELLRTRVQSPALRAFGERIGISQTDEIKFMKQWLEDRGQATSISHGGMDHMADMKGMDKKGADMKGMDMKGVDPKATDQLDSMSGMPPMPGMLTPEQMAALAKAAGAEFGRLFLTGMIQARLSNVGAVPAQRTGQHRTLRPCFLLVR